MDLDIAFVSALCSEGAPAMKVVLERGVDEDMLQGEGARAFKFVKNYYDSFKDTPAFDIVHGSTDIRLVDPQAPTKHFVGEIINRRLHGLMHQSLEGITAHMARSEPNEAFAAMEDAVRDIRKQHLSASRVISLPSLGPQYLEHYDKLKSGYRGVLTPWPTVNEDTYGFWPGDLVLFVARLSTGKTWLMVLMANHAWKVQGKRVLFVTTEMGQMKIAQRWIGTRFKLPYEQLSKARLDSFAEKRMRDEVIAEAKEDGFYIIGGGFDFSMSSLEAAIDEAEPEAMYVDGAYLLRSKGDSRNEKAANAFDNLKRMAKRADIPVVSTTQFNRDVKKDKASTVGPENIALTDVAGWNADLAYAAIQTQDMKLDKRLILRPIKFREGVGGDIELNWDFDKMDFDELPKGSGSAGSSWSNENSNQGSNGDDSILSGDGTLFGNIDEDAVPF